MKRLLIVGALLKGATLREVATKIGEQTNSKSEPIIAPINKNQLEFSPDYWIEREPEKWQGKGKRRKPRGR